MRMHAQSYVSWGCTHIDTISVVIELEVRASNFLNFGVTLLDTLQALELSAVLFKELLVDWRIPGSLIERSLPSHCFQVAPKQCSEEHHHDDFPDV